MGILSELDEHDVSYRSVFDEVYAVNPICYVCEEPWPCQISKIRDQAKVVLAEHAVMLRALHEIAGIPMKMDSLQSPEQIAATAVAKVKNLEKQRRGQQKRAQRGRTSQG